MPTHKEASFALSDTSQMNINFTTIDLETAYDDEYKKQEVESSWIFEMREEFMEIRNSFIC